MTHTIQVGIVAASSIPVTFNGSYKCIDADCLTDGPTAFMLNNEMIEWNGEAYAELLFTPEDKDASFDLHDVMIGIDFHWQRRERQRFEGSLRLTVENGLIRAINIIDLERYLLSVISSEMNGDSPLELLKAHAVISRSWLLSQIETKGKTRTDGMISTPNETCRWFDREDHTGFDVCADDHCQRYQGITRALNPHVAEAIESTRGEVLTDVNGRVCDARFSKCCGGVTELFENCWSDDPHDYLRSFRDNAEGENITGLDEEANARRWIMSSPDAFCNTADEAVLSAVLNSYDREQNDFYRWHTEYSASELSDLLRSRSEIDFGRIKSIKPLRRGPSGRIVRMEIVGEKCSHIIGKELMIRRWLSKSHLRSSAFVIDAKGTDSEGYPERFVIHGAGWGHGVGLCQIGAAVMASKGYDYRQILAHYFPGTDLTKDYRVKI